MTDTEAPSPASGRRRALTVIASLALLAGGAFLAYWLTIGQYREITDDAYVGGNVLQITPRRAGTVVTIHADEMDQVIQGQPLVTLDDADARAALAAARAELASAVRDSVRLTAQASELRAVITLRERELALAKDVERRRNSLSRQKLTPEEEAQQSRISVGIAAANVEVAHRNLAATEALIQDGPIMQQPAVQRAAAALRTAYLDYANSRIPAPIGGYVAKRSVQLGERVEPGEALMAIVPLDRLWVEANFKESQLTNLRIDQPVTLTADLYGDGVEFHGRIEGIAMGTGSAFALLPAQNASGNWIKIVQRVPVRIALDSQELAQHPLRLGLSMRVTVDTHTRDGAVLAAMPPQKAPLATPVFEGLDQSVDEMIKDIVRTNSRIGNRIDGEAAR